MSYGMTMLLAALVLLLLWMTDTLFFQSVGKGVARIRVPKRTDWRFDLLLFAAAWIVLFSLNNHEFIVYNNYSYLADALLHGRLDTPDLPRYLESIELGGKTYMHFAPGVAFLLLPLAALFGAQNISYAYVGITLGACNTVLLLHIFEHLSIGKNLRERFWCVVFVLFGTVHCFCAAIAHSWFIGHVASWFFLFLALFGTTMPYQSRVSEGVGMFFAGLAFGLCVCCRLSNLLGAGVFVAYILLFKRTSWLKCGLLFMTGAAVFGCLYMGMNVIRFGAIMDKSYHLTHLKDYFKPLYYFMQEHWSDSRAQMAFLNAVERTDWSAAFPTIADRTAFLTFLQRNAAESWNYCTGIPNLPIAALSEAELDAAFTAVVTQSFPTVGGPLSLHSIPYNLYSVFAMLPEFSTDAPYVIPTLAGVSITFCSPLVYACLVPLWTRRKEPMMWMLFGTAILTAIPFLMNYGNGFAQFGMRYAMDFLPYLLLLACIGLTAGRWHAWKTALVLLCVFINVWGPIYWNCFYL